MPLTKAVALITDWTAVLQNAVGESAIHDASGDYATTLHVDIALVSAIAHTGTNIKIQVSSAESGDEDWTDYHTILALEGTPNTEAINDNPLAAGSTVALVTSTTGYDADKMRWIYIKDGTIGNSELALLVSHIGNTSVTWQDGTINEHAQNTPMWNIASTYSIELPLSTIRARVIVDNTFDSNGAACDYRIRVSQVTGI